MTTRLSSLTVAQILIALALLALALARSLD